MSSFVALPMELQSCCVASLDLTSAGRFGQASQASRQLVNERLVEEKAACARAVYEKISSRWCETLAATWRVADGPDLITLSDGPGKDLQVHVHASGLGVQGVRHRAQLQ